MKKKIRDHFSNNYKSFYQKYLKSVKKIGDREYASICPFHEDTNPSFNFNSENGKYFCHGCREKGDIFHFYSKINGMDIKRHFKKILKGIANDFGIPWEEKKSKTVKTYDYTDADGKLLFQVCRMEPKDFRQRRPDGRGGWIWNLKGIEPVLYNLPAISEAEEVLVVEGEKDCDNLAKLGFTASTCPMGAKKWCDRYTEYLKDKRVILIPDNDNEGEEHMAQVGGSLNGKTANLKLIELTGLPSKGDVSDFIASFKHSEDAAERLSIMIKQAKPYKPPKKATIDDVVLQVNQFYELEFSPRQELLFPWLKEDSINLISGWRGCGKTWFALGIIDAVTRGTSFGPWGCNNPVPCLFLDGEMTVQDDRERIEILKLNSDRKSPLYFYSDAYAAQLGVQRANLTDESWRQNIKRILTTHQIKLWVLDNLASLASGLDENIKKDWDPINSWLLELRFAGISTIMLHHVNKAGGQRGTSAREDNLDISILLKAPPDHIPEDGARFVVHFNKARVQTKYLNLIGDTEFKMVQDETGQYIWSYGNVKNQNRNEVLRMLDDGMKYKEIAQQLNISTGLITKIKQQAIKDGYLSNKGQLTQDGFMYISGGVN